MKQILIQFSAFSFLFLSLFLSIKDEYGLTIEVENLRNSKGVLQVALYNKGGSIHDEDYKKLSPPLAFGVYKDGLSSTML
ncbi:MAG TPA: hypothetical protein PLE30_09990 [Candidatus Kapabacteria bacterium]|nr:hypothetical protein [Candidatus Kapabacteria bacterium]